VRSRPRSTSLVPLPARNPALEFRVLGPFEVFRRSVGVISIVARRERAILLCLLLHPNRIVPAEQLIDTVWGARPPRSADAALQNCVSHLRKLLEPCACGTTPQILLTRSPGYLLRVGPCQLDAARVTGFLERSRRACERGAFGKAVRLLRQAEGLWRGPALADFSFDDFAQSEIARLEELRLLTLAERIEAELALGRHAYVISELKRLVVEHPLDERFRGQLMLALYRSGRQADALSVYRAGRRTLDEELGLVPSRPLRTLEAAILRQEPFLDERALHIA
jgi:SARP family transcriptional regulator, regulator of embCAB operon